MSIKNEEKVFELPYWVKNGGDGSANVKFTPTFEEAEKLDEDQSEGWGESSANTLELKIKDGKIYYKSFKYLTAKDEKTGKYVDNWIELKEVKND
jgi:hypothetical protein